MTRQLVLTLLSLLILAGVSACGGSDVATLVATTPTASPTPAPDSIMTPRPNLASTPTATPSPTPTETPLANQMAASKSTETAYGQTMQESNSPRPGDEVFNLCQSDYGEYQPSTVEILLVDWTIDAYVRLPTVSSRCRHEGPSHGVEGQDQRPDRQRTGAGRFIVRQHEAAEERI